MGFSDHRRVCALRALLGPAALASLTAMAGAQGFPTELFGEPQILTGAIDSNTNATFGDLDGDGLPELVCRSNGSAVLVVHSGAGLLDEEDSYAIPKFIIGVPGPSLADFDADGALDVIQPDLVQAQVYTLRGHGDGTLDPYVLAGGLPGTIKSCDVGDIDADGFTDIVAGTGGLYAGTLALLVGHGDGTFAAAQTLASIGIAMETHLGDLDLDGSLDIAVQNSEELGGDDTVAIFLGAGDGTFQPAPGLSFDPTLTSHGLRLADLDRDGFPDVLLSAFGHAALVARGHGDGTFAPTQAVATGDFAALDIAAADIDLDGYADLVGSYFGFAQRLGPDLQSLGPAVALGFESPNAMAVIADFDGDSLCDIVFWSSWTQLALSAFGSISDLGYGSPAGPTLAVSGTPVAGGAATVHVSGPPVGTPVLVVIGLDPSHAQLAGSDLVPSADALLTLPAGLPVQMRWPASLQFGTPLYVQAIASDAGKPALSHALVIVPE